MEIMKYDLHNKLNSLLRNTGDMALKRRAVEIVSGLELKRGDRVLDVGCGDGYYLHLLSNIGISLKLKGTDFDESGLKKAKKNLGKGISLYQADLMKRLPFKTGTFDKVVMSEVAEHLPEDVRGLKEVYRIMKKGGIICLTVPNNYYPLFWDPVNWILQRTPFGPIRSGFFAGIWNQHERLYTPKQIQKVVEKAGFKVMSTKNLTFWCLPFNHYIVNLTARLLAHGNISKDSKSSLSKFEKHPKRKWYLDLAFGIVNALDKLNDIWSPKDKGVSVFIKAIK